MRKTVRRRHNKDGSVTTTTSYSRKGLLGTRYVDTYVSRTPAPRRATFSHTPIVHDPQKTQEQVQNKYKRKLSRLAFYCYTIGFALAFIIPLFMLLDGCEFSVYIKKWIDYLKGMWVIILPCLVLGTACQCIYIQHQRKWLEENDENADQIQDNE